jgi:putative spermidine/putrescine transport system ATP-binding protein
MADLILTGLTKHYGSTVAVDGLDLSVDDREFLTLLGPSGSGKTTVLRMIAGYIAPSSGTIRVGGRAVQDLPPERRDVGMVFQSYALFPHLTVFRNVAFGLERRRVRRAEIVERVGRALALVRLSGLDRRHPRELSGGQQQRVALARALVIAPTLLLLDEPMSNLDARLRDEVRLDIRRLQRELGITTVLVTHDQEEALTVSDRVAVIAGGRLQQVASPVELYEHPANRFVAEFVGRMNLLEAQRVGREPGHAVYRLDSGETLRAPDGPDAVLLAVRPEAIRLGTPAATANVNRLTATVADRSFLGELREVRLRHAGGRVLTVRGIELDPRASVPGQTVTLWWDVERTCVLARDR